MTLGACAAENCSGTDVHKKDDMLPVIGQMSLLKADTEQVIGIIGHLEASVALCGADS